MRLVKRQKVKNAPIILIKNILKLMAFISNNLSEDPGLLKLFSVII